MADRVAKTVWRRDDDILTRRTPRSVLVVPAQSDEPLVLEGAAVVVWDSLGQPATDDELVAAVAARFGVAVDDVRPAVIATREELHRRGALVGSDD